MKDLPIIMSPPMVRALLTYQKTQTRRLRYRTHTILGKRIEVETQWAKVRPGDALWVRELMEVDDAGCSDMAGCADVYHVRYHADGATKWLHVSLENRLKRLGVKPSIHMPRWASRITLKVANVRFQRLQDISKADAIQEGIRYERPTEEDNAYARENFGRDCDGVWIAPGTDCGFGPKEHREQWHVSAPLAYGLLWDHLHGKGSWDKNPEIVALTFLPSLCNIDEFLTHKGAKNHA